MGGALQRLALAKALMHAPDLLIQQVAAVLVHGGCRLSSSTWRKRKPFPTHRRARGRPGLLAALVLTRHRSIMDVLHWSQWRRHHQATARRCHYQRRSQP
jgi:hypothetical protein